MTSEDLNDIPFLSVNLPKTPNKCEQLHSLIKLHHLGIQMVILGTYSSSLLCLKKNITYGIKMILKRKLEINHVTVLEPYSCRFIPTLYVQIRISNIVLQCSSVNLRRKRIAVHVEWLFAYL